MHAFSISTRASSAFARSPFAVSFDPATDCLSSLPSS